MWQRLVGAGLLKGKEALENSQKSCSEYGCNEPRAWHSEYCPRHDKAHQEQAMNRVPLFPGLSGAFEGLFFIGFLGVFIFVVFKIGSCIF